MTYVCGMNFFNYCLVVASRPKAFGKHTKVRPPIFCVQDDRGGDSTLSVRCGAISVASSRISSPYRAVEQDAAARTTMLEAEGEMNRPLSRLGDTSAECSEQRKVIAAEIEAVQYSCERQLAC